jgi:hypothetical protein
MKRSTLTQGKSIMATTDADIEFLKSHGIASMDELLALIESAKLAPRVDCAEYEERIASAKDGWSVKLFFDYDGLYYVESLIAPDGREIDFWEWGETQSWKAAIIKWRDVSDFQD